MKLIELTTKSGSVWTVPASVVCMDRARYYKSREGGRAITRHEFEFCMSDDDTIIDWAKNNTDWEDVSAMARLVREPEEDMDQEWLQGEMEIIEQPSSSG